MENRLRQHCAPVLQGGVSAFCASGSVSHVHAFLTQQLLKDQEALLCFLLPFLRDQGCRASSHVPESIFETSQLNLPACLGSLSYKI